MTEVTCQFCGYHYQSRVKHPRRCARCGNPLNFSPKQPSRGGRYRMPIIESPFGGRFAMPNFSMPGSEEDR